MKIVCLGELLVDMTPTETVNNYTANPGGAPCNVAAAASKFGAKTALIGKVGDDIMGRLVKDTLISHGVDTSGVITAADEYTTLAFVKLSNGERSFSFYRLADARLRPDELDTTLIEEAGIFHFGSLSLTGGSIKESALFALSKAIETNSIISFDVNYRDKLWDSPKRAKEEINAVLDKLDFIKVSEEELELLTGISDIKKGAEFLIGKGVRNVVISLGERGSVFVNKNMTVSAESYRITPVDTTGAGDAFWGAFLAQLSKFKDVYRISKEDMYTILRKSNAAGAMSACKYGAIPSLPDKDELEAFYNKNN